MPRKTVPAFLVLLFLLIGCNLPFPTATMTPTLPSTVTIPPKATVTANPTATTYSPYPYIEVPIQAVLVSDDDGSHAVQISYEEIKTWVDRSNQIYAMAGIRFLFNLQDMTTLKSTLLNNMIGNQDAQWDEEVAGGNQVASMYPGRLTIFFRRGSGEYWLGGAFSSSNYNFVVMPQYSHSWCDNQDDNGMLAHEIGHYLGLGHIFPAVFSSVAEAENFLQGNNNVPNIFDGDGLSDTPPDPGIYDNYYSCTSVSEVTLNGINFTLPRENIMSYYNGRTSLSGQQSELVRWYLQKRQQNEMAMPTNVNAPNPLEANKLGILDISGCSAGYQNMTGFGDAHRWYNDDHLFVSSGQHCSLTLSLPVATAGQYRLDVYMTQTPDFGQVQVLLDGATAGVPIELYAPSVMPSGPITLGTFDLAAKTHSLTFKVVGKNALSPYYSLGIDCISLVPVP